MTLIALLFTGLSATAVQNWRARQRAVDLSRSLRESEARWRATFEGHRWASSRWTTRGVSSR